MNMDLYNIFIEKYLEKFKDSEEDLYNFRCISSCLRGNIVNYEYWAKLKDLEHITETLDCFNHMLKTLYQLKSMGCEVPKLTKLCKNTTYIKTLIKA